MCPSASSLKTEEKTERQCGQYVEIASALPMELSVNSWPEANWTARRSGAYLANKVMKVGFTPGLPDRSASDLENSLGWYCALVERSHRHPAHSRPGG